MQEFQVLKELGKGSFGRVLKVKRKDDPTIFAMKTIQMMQLSQKQKQLAVNQVRLLASIDSPYVIKYKGAFFQECGNILSILMEFADGGDLEGLIKNQRAKRERFDERCILRIAQNILKGLYFLHTHNIIHRDIKTGNIFFVNGVAQIGDLNLSKIMKEDFAITKAGTPFYTSPQIWLGNKYSFKCDIWSLGCLLYQMCSFKPPFHGTNFPQLMKKVTSGFYQPISSVYSKQLSTLIRKCLTVNPERRSSAQQLLQWSGFASRNHKQEGQLRLIDTIKCPRVLKNLNNQLPIFYSPLKQKTERESTKKYPSTSINFRKADCNRLHSNFSPISHIRRVQNNQNQNSQQKKMPNFIRERKNYSQHKTEQAPTFKVIRY